MCIICLICEVWTLYIECAITIDIAILPFSCIICGVRGIVLFTLVFVLEFLNGPPNMPIQREQKVGNYFLLFLVASFQNGR